MYESSEYLEEDFIIWNSSLGIRDFVTIGEINSSKKEAWLDEPYEMVGPFCLEKLCTIGKISFEACMVMSKKYWRDNQELLRKEAFIQQSLFQQKFQEDINNHNKKREKYRSSLEISSQKEYRQLLCLPLEGVLENIQIKEAFKKLAKTAHPDVGGTHEMFVKISQARDALMN